MENIAPSPRNRKGAAGEYKRETFAAADHDGVRLAPGRYRIIIHCCAARPVQE